MIEFDKKISEFITSAPLYSKLEVRDGPFGMADYHGLTFDFYCPNCIDGKTFELEVYPNRVSWNDDYCKDTKGKILNTTHYKGTCKHCNQYKIDIVLNTFTEEEIVIAHGKNRTKVYIRKIGQYPPFEITPEGYLLKYLNKEDKENYKKGLLLLSQSYGIGAYAYFRRIVENEILRIIEDISKLDFADGEKVKDLLTKYNENHQMTNLIEGIYKFLPDSLKSLGHNPIKVLHDQLSQGIHSLSEDNCLDKAKMIDVLLKFVIKRINEEQSTVLDAKKALNMLTTRNTD